MPNLVTQSLKILNGAVKEVGKDYFANLTTFYNDAKNVKNTMLNASTDVADTYAKIKKTNITKTISDWFYQTETDSDMDMNMGDDFDAGFEVSSSKDSKKLDGDSDTPKALTADAMTNITNKQTNTMLKIGRRQTEQSVANTAEIISTIDTRTSEMLTSLNNINKTLLGISSRLDKLIEFQTFSVEEKKEIDKGGLYQDGNLSLGRIFEASKQNVLNSGPMSYLTMGLDYFKTGALTPTALASIGLKGLAGKIKVNGKSFDDWGNAFNEIVGTATQTAMNEMINSSVFKKIIGDITSFEQDKDYGKIVPNHYDNKRTYLDGMMKVSIVDVIPQMLAKINQSISGQEYHLDGRGKWIAGPMKNEFNEVTRASFANTGINSTSTMNRISNAGVQSIGKKIPDADIEMAAKALTMAIVMDQHSKGQRAFTISQLKGDISGYVSNAVQVLVMTDNANANYWANVCQCIAIQLSSGLMDASGFVRNINDSLQRMITEATNFAQSGKANATQAGKLSFNMAANQFLAEYGSQSIKNATNTKNNSGTLLDGNIKVDPTNKLGKYSLNQYIGGIFQLLNRGINVKIDGKGRYSELKLEDVRPDAAAFVTDDTFGEAIKDALTGGGNMKSAVKNAVKESMLGSDDGKEEGFLKKILSNPAMLLNSATNLFTGGTVNADGLKGKAKNLLGEDRYNAIADKFGSVKDRIKNDDRYIAAKMAAEEAVEKVKNKGREIGDKLGHTRIGNNLMYAKDSLSLKSAESTINHMTIEDEIDQETAAITKYYTSRGMLDEAERAAAGIKNQTVRKAYMNFVSIHKKRIAGAQAVENGQTPDIGAVMMTKDPTKITKDDNERSILGKILRVVGKIGKAVVKLGQSGIRDIYYGIKSMGQGLFGYKDFDPKTGKTIKNKGLFRNLTTELVAAMFRSSKGIVKGIGSAIKKKVTKDGEDNRTLRERWEGKVDKWAKNNDKLGYAAVGEYTRNADGKLQAHTAMTYADALKHPVEAVTKSLSNFGQNLKFVGNTVTKGAKKVFDGIFGFLKDFKKNVSNLWGSFKKTTFGNFLTNNKFIRGFTSGFKEAKAAKEVAAKKAKAAQDREEHPLQAEIVDSLSAPDEGKKKGIFHSIYDKLFGAQDSLFSLIKRQTEIAEETAEKEDENSEEGKEKTGFKGAVNAIKGMKNGGNADIGDVTSTTSEADISPDTGGGSSGGAGILGHIGNTLGSIGKLFGGFMQTWGGVVKLIVAICSSLEGFQALQTLIQSIWTEGIKPLNEIFESLMDLIKPTVKMLTKVIQTVAKTISIIAKSIIDAIQPIMEAVQPIFEAIFSILEPILKVITVIMDVILMPIKMLLETFKPLFESIAYKVQMVSGILEIVTGYLLQGLGLLVQGIGNLMALIGKIPMIGDGGENGQKIADIGSNMRAGADAMIQQGKDDFMEGLKGSLGKILEFFTGEKYEPKVKETANEAYGTPAKLGNDFGSGDAYTNNVTNNYYGNGNPMDQHSYGKYMNMSDRGCGPIALADAYGRRSGNSVNPGTLAGMMAGAGAYDPSRGTSVNNMLAMGNAMGMGMRAGGVTAASIKQATPDRPITLLGSGSGYGTRSGHNHYVNVIGTDKAGGAYISNPMTGKIERQNAGSLVTNAKLGLYGSGDDDDLAEYGFSDAASESLSRLKAISSKFTSIFQGEDSEASDNKNKQAINYMQSMLGDDKYNDLVNQTKEELKNRYPQEQNETDEEYERRITNKVSTPEGRKILASLGKDEMSDNIAGRISNANSAIDSATDALNTAGNALAEHVKSMIASFNMTSDAETGAEMAKFEPILHLEPELTEGENGRYYNSPVHDFFNARSIEGKSGAARSGGAKGIVYSSANGGWFKKYGGPQNAQGEGSSGQDHEGVLLTYTNTGGDGNAVARAITGGTVTYVTKDDRNPGLGNSVKWRDSGGMYHWYMHLASIDRDIQEGSNIEPGQLIGYFGRSGLDAKGKKGNGDEYDLPNVMRYVVTSAGPQGNTGDPGYINPFTYWQFRAQSDDLMGNSEKEQIYNYFVNHFGMSEAGAAGVMGVLSCEGMLEPEPYAAQMEGIFGDGKAEASKKYATLEAMNDYTVNSLFPAYANQGVGINRGGYLSDGLYLPGIGLAQWTGPRARGLYDFAKSKGMNWYDLQAQLDFMEAEKSNTFNSLLTMMSSKNITPKQAADAWMTQYEAGCSGTDPYQSWLSAREITNRENSAEQLYQQLYGHVTNAAAAKTDEDGVYTGRFIASTTNPSAFGSSDILKSAAEVFSAWNGGTYMQGDSGSLKLANGTSIPHFRPDCSGSITGVIRNMGYDVNVKDATGFRTYDLLNKTTNDMVYKNGQPSSDWKFLPYSHGALQPGDIIVAKEHMGMYIAGPDNSSWGNLGYDGGATSGFVNSARGANAYLSGDSDWQSKLAQTLSGADTGDDKLQTILRYVGAASNTSSGEYTTRGGLTFLTGQTSSSDNNTATVADVMSSGGMAAYVTKQNEAADSPIPSFNMWSASSYLKAGSDRNKALDLLVKYHNMATDQSGKNYNDYYHNTYGGKVTRSDMNEWMLEYINKEPRESFSDMLFDLHKLNPGKFTGAGDAEIITQDVPPLDLGKLTDTSQYTGLTGLNQFINKYSVKTDDQATTDMLNKLGSMTFNVRAQRVEELLEILIAKVDGGSPSDAPLPNLFNEGIPEPVSRLSMG